ncbi:ABC transporter permease [Scytonema hofmannii PCC 7110]|uniref:ABC transporter permease n=1 Tax=Scytonema hofmannii PCC 7110 TaxID=128403 RepID=A0A139X365_9CYAN|nr:DMT family transporter [Scytonema hofmannii]KYC39147.1 ABC transporter permease [Scytonema hofmannii PCC 7110]
MRVREWMLLFILSLLWGGSYFFIKIVLVELQPFTVVLGRVSFAAIALICFVYLSGQQMPVSPRIWRAFFVMGALNNLIPFSLIVWGQTQIDSSLTGILNATTPLFTVVLAHLLTHDERLSLNRLFGVLFGLCGVFLLIGLEVLHGLNLQSLGQFAILGASFCYSYAGIYGGRFKELSPVVTSAGMLTSSTVMILPLALMLDKPWTLRPSAITWGGLLVLGLFGSAIANLIYFRILAVAGATNVSLVSFLIPITALLLGVFVLGERLDWNTFAGMALIFTGLVAIDGRLLRLP